MSIDKFITIPSFGINIYFLNKDFYEIGFKLKDFGDGKNLKELSCYIFDIHVCDFNGN